MKQFVAFRLGEVTAEGAGLASELRVVKVTPFSTPAQLHQAGRVCV